MNCAKYHHRLSDYLDGTLGAEDAAQMREHLLLCVSCRQDYDSMARLRELLRALPEVPSRYDFWPRMHGLIQQRSPENSRRQQATSAAGWRWASLISLSWKSATVTTLAVALLLALPMHWHEWAHSLALRPLQENAALSTSSPPSSASMPSRNSSAEPPSAQGINSASLIALHAANVISTPLAEAGRMRYTISEASQADILDSRPAHHGIQDIH